MVSRVSTIGVNREFIRNISTAQEDLSRIQSQIASGKRAFQYSELSAEGQTERVLGINSELKRIDNYIRLNNIVSSRLNIVDDVLSKLQDTATELRDALTIRKSAVGSSTGLDQIAQSKLDVVVDSLNTRYEGRSLFSGGKTDQDPVDVSLIATNIIEGVATDNYYQGDNSNISVRANDTLDITYNIKANDQTFKDLFASIYTAIEGHQNDDEVQLDESFDYINKAIDGLAALRTKVNNQVISLNQANNFHEDTRISLEGVIEQVTDTDVVEATIQASLNQTRLQAAFQLFSRNNQLSLVEFI